MNTDKITDSTRDVDAFLATMRERFKYAEEALQEIHAEALADYKFRLGEQFPRDVKTQREQDGRPCYEINRVPQFLRQLTATQKKAQPAIEVSPIGSGADVETAEIVQGLVRSIERASNASEAYDTAFDHMATGGFGFLRLVTDYCDDESDDQEIKFEREPNSFAHFPDPRCKERDYSDAKYWFVTSTVLRVDFQEDYPHSSIAGLADFSGLVDQAPGWIQRDSLRLVEYFWITYQETKKKGSKRIHKVPTVHWCKSNGIEILEEKLIPGKYIPVSPVLGEELIVDGKRHLIGLVRNMKTPGYLYSLWHSAMAEAIALAPKAPWTATPKQVEGLEEYWEKANSKAWNYLPYNPDKDAERPTRVAVEPAIQAIIEAIGHADNDLKSTSGINDASLGQPGPEQSGKAILLRQKQGEGATFGFTDAMPTAVKHCGRIIAGWIPYYYDAQRVIRVVNPDATSKVVTINNQNADPNQSQISAGDPGLQKVFDLTSGTYDVAIKQGQSYDSARQEAADAIMQLIQASPELMQVCGDLLVQNFDWPMAKEISERLKKMLPAQLQDDQSQQIPPHAQAQMTQQAQLIQQMTTMIHQMSAKLEGQQVQSASRERIAMINAKAGILEAALKAKSAEALAVFQADIAQIDRQLALIPDPALGEEAGPGAGQPASVQQPQPAQQPLAA